MRAAFLVVAIGLSSCAPLWQTPQEIDASRRTGPTEPPGPVTPTCGYGQPPCPSGFSCKAGYCDRAGDTATPTRGTCNSDADCAGGLCQAGFCKKGPSGG